MNAEDHPLSSNWRPMNRFTAEIKLRTHLGLQTGVYQPRGEEVTVPSC